MYDRMLIREKLEQILEALLRIQRRSEDILSPDDFEANDENLDKLDAIAMMLIAVGEAFKKIDKETGGELLLHYPQIDWRGVMGVRNVLAHDYFDIDTEEIFKICHKDIPLLAAVVTQMLKDV